MIIPNHRLKPILTKFTFRDCVNAEVELKASYSYAEREDLTHARVVMPSRGSFVLFLLLLHFMRRLFRGSITAT